MVPTRSVAAAVEVPENLMVRGLLSLTIAMGTLSRVLEPTVYVNGPQDAMRESVGCIRNCLSALRKPLGWPSHSPIRQTEVLVSVSAAMFAVVAFPAETVTLAALTLNSHW